MQAFLKRNKGAEAVVNWFMARAWQCDSFSSLDGDLDMVIDYLLDAPQRWRSIGLSGCKFKRPELWHTRRTKGSTHFWERNFQRTDKFAVLQCFIDRRSLECG